MTKPSFRRIAGAVLIALPILYAGHLLPWEVLRIIAEVALFLFVLVVGIILITCS